MLAWVHTYDNHVQVFMDHVTTEKPAFIDKKLLEQFCHPLCTENDHSALQFWFAASFYLEFKVWIVWAQYIQTI